jgi:1-acyl-sn-glycerol-3-phosphate acyltransferase
METETERHLAMVPRLVPYFNLLRRYHQHRTVGIEHVPRVGGAMLVINHSFCTYDSLMLGAAIYEERGRFMRALADRRVLSTPGLKQLFGALGTVDAGMEAGKALLRAGELLVVAPGGMREAIRGHDERYKLMWERRTGFARLSMLAQAPIILAACPKADDVYKVHSGALSTWLYRNMKLPVVLPLGVAGTAIPRPVQLTHHFGAPISPPRIDPGAPEFEAELAKYHRYLCERMEELMAQALDEHPPAVQRQPQGRQQPPLQHEHT